MQSSIFDKPIRTLMNKALLQVLLVSSSLVFLACTKEEIGLQETQCNTTNTKNELEKELVLSKSLQRSVQRTHIIFVMRLRIFWR